MWHWPHVWSGILFFPKKSKDFFIVGPQRPARLVRFVLHRAILLEPHAASASPDSRPGVRPCLVLFTPVGRPGPAHLPPVAGLPGLVGGIRGRLLLPPSLRLLSTRPGAPTHTGTQTVPRPARRPATRRVGVSFGLGHEVETPVTRDTRPLRRPVRRGPPILAETKGLVTSGGPRTGRPVTRVPLPLLATAALARGQAAQGGRRRPTETLVGDVQLDNVAIPAHRVLGVAEIGRDADTDDTPPTP